MESPLPDKIGTNYAPLESEIAQIKELLLAPSAEIERIDHTIAKLRHKRRKLRTSVDEHRALISPIRRLPSDIIREIFIACIPADQNATMSAQEAPLLLGRICSAWRTISLSTPRLWSSIHIVEPGRDSSTGIYEGCLRMAKTWLGRSGGLPLSISLRGSPLSVPSTYFDTIVSFSQRWKHISLSGCSRMRLSRAQVPMLKSIQILDYALWDEPRVAETQDFLGGVCLESAVIGTDINPMELPLPWSQLTSLILTRINRRRAALSSSTSLSILSECSNLRLCSLALTSGADETATVPSSVELPFLSSLKVSISSRGSFQPEDLLDRLVVPQLSEFVFSAFQITEDATPFPFPTLISTASKLQSVDIEAMFFKGDSLTNFLRRLPPSVQSLCLRQSILGVFPPSVVDQDILLLLSPGPDMLLPKLETIHATGFSDAELLHFILSRMGTRSAPRLRRLKAQFFRCAEKDILAELRPLIDEFDMDISLKYLAQRERWNPREGLRDGVDTTWFY